MSDIKSIFDELVSNGVDISFLSNDESDYYKPIINLILNSSVIAQHSNESWEYKSLADIGAEEFCTGSVMWAETSFRHDKSSLGILRRACNEYSMCISRYLLYTDEGLNMYMKNQSDWINAERSEDMIYAQRMIKEVGYDTLEFIEPPEWAKNLHLNFRNKEIWSYFYTEANEEEAMLYKAKAIELFTNNTELINTKVDDVDFLDKPLNTREKRSMLAVIAALCEASELHWEARGTGEKIANITNQLGYSVSADTIRKFLKDLPDAIESKKK